MVWKPVTAFAEQKPRTSPTAPAAPSIAPEADVSASTPADGEAPGISEPTWPDDSAEAAFLADARERGEVVKPMASAAEPVEESDPKSLPKLEDLVNRIPAEVRDTLEDLFRAKFVRVQRIPKRALKS